jgi:biopolymer transport protein ExbB
VEELESVLDVIRHGGVAMYPLLLCSVLALAVSLERLLAIRRARVDAGGLIEQLREPLARGDLEEARQICQRAPVPISAVALAGLAKLGRPRQEMEDAMRHASNLAMDDLESNLPVLGTIGGITPFIGLFGTVLGIMRAFRDIQARGQAGTAVVAGGVSEALVATAAGLVIAILAVVAYNAFLNRIGRIETRLDAARSELLYFLLEGDGCTRRHDAAMRVEIG